MKPNNSISNWLRQHYASRPVRHGLLQRLGARLSTMRNPLAGRQAAPPLAQHPWIARAKLKFGTTHDPREAGYLTPNGEFLDFSGKRQGGHPGTRSYDHRDIWQAMGNAGGGSNGMLRFIGDTGSIRWSLIGDSLMLDIAQEPTPAQLREIADYGAGNQVIIEITDTLSGHTLRTLEIDNAKPVTIRNKLKQVFAEPWPRSANPRFYHGTANVFDKPDPARFDAEALYGPGYYLTSSPDVAGGYATQARAPKQQSMQAASNLDALQESYRKRLTGTLDTETRQATEREITRIQRVLDEHYKASTAGPNLQAVDVPEGLRLFDAEARYDKAQTEQLAAGLPELTGHILRNGMGYFRQEKHGAPTGDDLYQLIGETLHHNRPWTLGSDDKREVNKLLAGAGYDGIRYAGGKRLPMKDEHGRPIKHEALVIFPESLGRLQGGYSRKPLANPIFRKIDPRRFVEGRSKSTRPWYLTQYPATEMRSFTRVAASPDAKVGYALKRTDEGTLDLVNVYNAGGPKGAGGQAILDGIVHGAETLDAFDGHLRETYQKFGFRVYKQYPWADEYAPENWPYETEGRPDILYMRYEGGPSERRQAARTLSLLQSAESRASSPGHAGVAGRSPRVGGESSTAEWAGLDEPEQGASRRRVGVHQDSPLLGNPSEPLPPSHNPKVYYPDDFHIGDDIWAIEHVPTDPPLPMGTHAVILDFPGRWNQGGSFHIRLDDGREIKKVGYWFWVPKLPRGTIWQERSRQLLHPSAELSHEPYQYPGPRGDVVFTRYEDSPEKVERARWVGGVPKGLSEQREYLGPALRARQNNPSYFRVQPANEDPNKLLDPRNWASRLWSGESYKPCPSCSGTGEGRWEDDWDEAEPCEECGGTGQIDDSERRGVSAMRSVADLRRYFKDRGATTKDTVIVEVDGEESEDEDWDADEGAVLVYPSRILSVQPFTAHEKKRNPLRQWLRRNPSATPWVEYPTPEGAAREAESRGNHLVYRMIHRPEEVEALKAAIDEGRPAEGFLAAALRGGHQKAVKNREIDKAENRGAVPVFTTPYPTVAVQYENWADEASANVEEARAVLAAVTGGKFQPKRGAAKQGAGMFVAIEYDPHRKAGAEGLIHESSSLRGASSSNAAYFCDSEEVIDARSIKHVSFLSPEQLDRVYEHLEGFECGMSRGIFGNVKDKDAQLAAANAERARNLEKRVTTLGRTFIEAPAKIAIGEIKKGDRVVLATGVVTTVTGYRPMGRNEYIRDEAQQQEFLAEQAKRHPGATARLQVGPGPGKVKAHDLGLESAYVPGLDDYSNVPDSLVLRVLKPGERITKQEVAALAAKARPQFEFYLRQAIEGAKHWKAESEAVLAHPEKLREYSREVEIKGHQERVAVMDDRIAKLERVLAERLANPYPKRRRGKRNPETDWTPLLMVGGAGVLVWYLWAHRATAAPPGGV